MTLPKNANSNTPPTERTAPLADLYTTLQNENNSKFTIESIEEKLEQNGISPDEPRIRQYMENIQKTVKDKYSPISKVTFIELLQDPNTEPLRKALATDLVIPSFQDFKKDIEEIYTQVKPNTDGKPSERLPHPEAQDPPAFAVSICTVDGQLLQLGEHNIQFSIQSICKPINYAIALQENGEDKVHQHVGLEPGSEDFDQGGVLNEDDLPHNPLINSGSIMCDALIQPELDNKERLEHVQEIWEKLSGNKEIGYSKEAYEKEINASDKNFALTFLMNQRGAFPEGTDLSKTIEFHTHCCSIAMSIDALAHSAASLAKFGVCPSTGIRIFSHDTVKNTLSIMLSSGLYSHSGEYAFWVGMPSKSGIAGGLMVVIPHLMGIAIYSPPLDQYDNSVRGIDFCERLVKKFNFHVFDSILPEDHGKKDPRKKKVG